MNFVVLLKQVPDVSQIPAEAWDQEKGTLKRAMLDNVLNPLDLHALTLACRIRDKAAPDGRVVCVTMGIPSAAEMLLDAMARGADEGVLLTDSCFAGADTVATARSIELAVRKIQVELFHGDSEYILVAGMQSVDGDTAQVPPQLAQALDIDLIAYVTEFEFRKELFFKRIGPAGVETVKTSRYPVMLTVTDCTEPIYPSFRRTREIRTRADSYRTWNGKDIGADPAQVGTKGSRTQVVRIFSPKKVQKNCRIVKNPADLVPLLKERLDAEASPKAAESGPAYSLQGKEPTYRGEIWTFVETNEGALLPVVGELLNKLRELEAVLGAKVGAVLLGSNVRAIVPQLFAMGAETVYLADDPKLAHYRSIPYSHVVSRIAQKHKPQIMLFGATPLGRELAPRVAYVTQSGLTADCTQLDIGDFAGGVAILQQTRPALGGNIMATIVAKSSATQMATVRPGVFPSSPLDASLTGSVIEYAGEIPEGSVEVLSVAPAPSQAKLSGADIIVAGGAGIRNAENFNKLVRPLAQGLGKLLSGTAIVAASRAAVERNFVSRDYQIGQTGQTVEPLLYLAIGISGAVQHISGMQKSRLVVAINPDAKAPIFRIADFGIVGKAEKVVPALLEALQTK